MGYQQPTQVPSTLPAKNYPGEQQDQWLGVVVKGSCEGCQQGVPSEKFKLLNGIMMIGKHVLSLCALYWTLNKVYKVSKPHKSKNMLAAALLNILYLANCLLNFC